MERQMDFFVCTRCPEEVKSRHTEGPEKRLLTCGVLKIRSAFLSLRPGAPGVLAWVSLPRALRAQGGSRLLPAAFCCSAGPEDPSAPREGALLASVEERGLNPLPRALCEGGLSRAES